MEKRTVLVVEDETKIRTLLKDFLERERFNVLEAVNGKQALGIYENMNDSIDLILLDGMLPHHDSWTVCGELRKSSDVPIIMLAARTEDSEEIHGFEIGTAEYSIKPVKTPDVTAQINALLRRLDRRKGREKSFSFDGLVIDDSSHVVTVDGEEIILSPKEYALLLILAENKSMVVSREQLLNQIWGYEYFGGLRTVDTHINRLRAKLGRKGNAVVTVRSYGYRFEG